MKMCRSREAEVGFGIVRKSYDSSCLSLTETYSSRPPGGYPKLRTEMDPVHTHLG